MQRTSSRSARAPRRARNAVPLSALFAALLLAGCGESATSAVESGFGPNPTLPAPNKTLMPTVNVAPAVGWIAGAMPTAAAGLQVAAFADKLDHPRWLYVLPNGDVLVAETNAPPRPDDGKGIKGWFQQRTMTKAGATVPSPDRITLLRDSNGDGVADERHVFRSGLTSPFGMALVGNQLYVANTDALVRFDYTDGATALVGEPHVVAPLPAGTINHHWTKNVIASADGATLYVTVGSNSNVAENGIEAEAQRAGILAIDAATGATRVFASGLRNPNGMAWEPQSGVLWTAVNERDEIGSDLVPDYMTSVNEGDFFGWPYSYYGQHVDERVDPPRPDLVAKARMPDYALGPHTASLGLAFNTSALFGGAMREGAFVGQHGSWNRKPFSGYQVIFVPFAAGKPAGAPQPVLTGFIDADGNAQGRPVGVAFDKPGALLVADDVGNVIWRVTPRAG